MMDQALNDISWCMRGAVTLYGVVTIEEVFELYKRWHPGTPLTAELMRNYAEYLLVEVDLGFIIHKDKFCHTEFDVEDEAEADEIIQMFIADRDKKPRWYPASEAEFSRFECDEYALASNEGRKFVRFVEKHGPKDQSEREEIMLWVILQHQQGKYFQDYWADLCEDLNLKSDAQMGELAGILMDFLNSLHLRSNNGWTARDLARREAPQEELRQPKIGRNDPCPCGSGKKYKKCCGR